jgi:hypothetical protein
LRLTAEEGSNNAFNQFTPTLINVAERTIPKTCGKLKTRQNHGLTRTASRLLEIERPQLKNSWETLRNQTLNQLELFDQMLIELSVNPRETAIREFKRDSWRSCTYIETEFKYTDEEGMGNGKTSWWQVATFSHPSLTGEWQ